jgi:hypothetical protein
MLKLMERKAEIWHWFEHIDLETIRTLVNIKDMLHGRHIGLYCVRCRMYVPFDDLDPVTATGADEAVIATTINEDKTRRIGQPSEREIDEAIERARKH